MTTHPGATMATVREERHHAYGSCYQAGQQGLSSPLCVILLSMHEAALWCHPLRSLKVSEVSEDKV